MSAKRQEPHELHPARSDGAGLVEADRIDTGKRLDAVALLHEHVLGAKPRRRDSQDRRRQEHEALWNHRDKRCHDREDSRIPCHAFCKDAPQEEAASEERHEDRRELDDHAKRVLDLGLRLLHILRFCIDLGSIGRSADTRDSCHERSGVDEAAGEYLISRSLVHGIGFSRKQALVHGDGTSDNSGICRHLVTMREADDIVLDDIGNRNLLLLPVADDKSIRCSQKRQTVDRELCADLLDDTDEEVREHDHHEEHVAVLPGQEYKQRQHGIDAVEEREGMLGDNLGNRFRLYIGICIDEAFLPALLHFGGAQSLKLLVSGVLRHESSSISAFRASYHAYPKPARWSMQAPKEHHASTRIYT